MSSNARVGSIPTGGTIYGLYSLIEIEQILMKEKSNSNVLREI